MRDSSAVLTRTVRAVVPAAFLAAGAVPSAGGELAEFRFEADPGRDVTLELRQAIAHCRENKVKKLVLAPGRYNLWPDQAQEAHLFVSNNDAGLKRIGFPLTDLNDFEIDGSGATLIFHGPMVPFLIERSSGITLRNLTFDFSRPFHSEGGVLAITPDSVDLEFSPEFPYAIRNGVLVFTGPARGQSAQARSPEILYPYGSLLAFDAERRETAYMAKDRYGVQNGIVAREIGRNRVRLLLEKVSAQPGNILVFGPPREHPGVVISDSSRVQLEDVTIHHCGGMGVIAQRSEDLFLNKVRVVPPEGGKRVVSVTADATHFVNSKGRIELTNCVFEGQKDDATNIHGLYARISRRIAPDQIEIQLAHPQQHGVDFVKPGMRLELTHGPSLQPLGYAVARNVTRLNKEYTIVETEKPLPESLAPGDAVADADANTAEVLIKNCTIAKNRARGILLGSRGRTVVEANTFHTPGAAILFEGDARFWFEQAGVREVVIRDNVFENCNFGVWGKACIEVGTGMAKEARKTSRYNKNITIENNLFRVFDSTPLLSIYAVDGLRFRGNRLEKTTAYPPRPHAKDALFILEDSDNLKVEDPR